MPDPAAVCWAQKLVSSAQVCAASARGDVVSRLRAVKARPKGHAAIELLAIASGNARAPGRFEPGGGCFKRVNYMNPETQFDKGNEWVEYFQKTFVQ